MRSDIRAVVMSMLLALGLVSCVQLPKEHEPLAQNPALPGLTLSGERKIKSEFLAQLLNKNLAEPVIVEYVTPPIEELRPIEKNEIWLLNRKELNRKTKAEANAVLSATEYEVVKDWDTLPSSFLKLKTPNALVKLLNSPKVRAVYEDRVIPMQWHSSDCVLPDGRAGKCGGDVRWGSVPTSQ